MSLENGILLKKPRKCDAVLKMNFCFQRTPCCDPFPSYNSRRQSTMMKKFSFFGIVLVCSVFVLIIFVSHRLVTNTSFEYMPFQSIGRTIQSWSAVEDISDRGDNSLFYSLVEENHTLEILSVINEQRAKIRKEMKDYTLSDGTNSSEDVLRELIPELGGNPIRSIILTTWRSGSTFLGDVLNSYPANFYHYEPLLDFGIVQIRGPPNAKKALNTLSNLLNCNYTGLDHYLNYGKEHIWLFNHNVRLWEQCQQHPSICWSPEFLNPFCRLFPIQSMKIVRLRLRLIEELLKDERLNIRVLLLVRDPRGTLQSRKHRDWCPGNQDCDQAALLCADLVSDYSAALRLTEKYPKRFMAMRYEDLSLNPYKMVGQLLEFYGLEFHPEVQFFLDTHTKINVGGVSSTYRNSASAPFHWRQDLTHREVRLIQNKCGPAMKYWGYLKAENASHQRVFNPVVNFTLT
ncbi:hypothetical protein RUM43_011040 [Polyplax serrata]|uniref:Sulfotransferase domain-containing protein n=1 Tax=Polyplax serrata TaxID=468196 RepID=A0AAN8RZP7_POLSC